MPFSSKRLPIAGGRGSGVAAPHKPVILSEAEGPPRSFFLYIPIGFTLPAPIAHDYFVYILTDKGHSTLYIGVTNNLATRLWQYRNPEKSLIHPALSLHSARLR